MEKLIFDSKMFERFKDSEYEKQANEAVRRLEYILSRRSENLINLFHLDSEEGGSDIELTILRAFLNSKIFIQFVYYLDIYLIDVYI
jgi:hypothetical protein